MSQIRLDDGFTKTGTELTELNETLRDMDDMTFCAPVRLDEIEVLSVTGRIIGEDGIERVTVLRNIPGSKQPIVGTLSLESMRKGGATEDLLDEMFGRTKLLLRINQQVYFTSTELLNTLPQRIKLGGTQILIPTPKRDEYINELFGLYPIRATLMYRRIGRIKKAFSLFTRSYSKIDQTLLTDIISNIGGDLGRPKCESWTVEHPLSSVVISFPDKARDIAAVYKLPNQITPCLYLGTSDTGNSSITAIGKLMIDGKSCVYSDVYRRKHRGDVNPGTLLAEIENKIFAKYTRLPERLCELMTVPVSNPRTVAKQVLDQIRFTGETGKELGAELTRALLYEFTPGLSYTAYDVAVAIMTLPSRCSGVAKSTIEKLEEVCGRAPFVQYQTKATAVPVLLPA